MHSAPSGVIVQNEVPVIAGLVIAALVIAARATAVIAVREIAAPVVSAEIAVPVAPVADVDLAT